jgi:hypothetical protein
MGLKRTITKYTKAKDASQEKGVENIKHPIHPLFSPRFKKVSTLIRQRFWTGISAGNMANTKN